VGMRSEGLAVLYSTLGSNPATLATASTALPRLELALFLAFP
jgi:hypothetical protein